MVKPIVRVPRTNKSNGQISIFLPKKKLSKKLLKGISEGRKLKMWLECF